MQTNSPALRPSKFPQVRRQRALTLQLDLGDPDRRVREPAHFSVSARAGVEKPDGNDAREPVPAVMGEDTIETALRVLARGGFETLELSGAAPERHPGFRRIVQEARRLGVGVILRTDLPASGAEHVGRLAQFLADHGVTIIVRFPSLSEDETDRLDGPGTFAARIGTLRLLNAAGYGQPGRNLALHLTHSPVDGVLPAPQAEIRAAYARELGGVHGIAFDAVHAVANPPIGTFGKQLVARGTFRNYLQTLRDEFRDSNLERLMCRTTVSVDWQGRLHDCPHNRAIGLTMLPRDGLSTGRLPGLEDLIRDDLSGRLIRTADHCFSCAAGQGSGRTGALEAEGARTV
ncbi:MAG: hypothetical protein RIS35_734 [Pseudomonadota bacterium]